MSSPTESKKSSRRPYKRIVVEKSAWKDWRRGEEHEIEFEGMKIKGMIVGNILYLGRELKKTAWDTQGYDINPVCADSEQHTSTQSCAYRTVCPQGKTDQQLAVWKYWLNNVHLPRGYVAYLTHKDAGVPMKGGPRLDELRDIMKKRGFKEVCCNRSIHTGAYPVWLLVHPGDPAILAERKNKKNKAAGLRKETAEVNDADVLGNPDANVLKPGVAGDTARSNTADRVVPNAPAIAPGVPEAPLAGVGAGHDILIGRAIAA